MLTKVTRNDLDNVVKTELDDLGTTSSSALSKADQSLTENDTQDTRLDGLETEVTTINDVMVKSVEGVLPDENGNVNLADATGGAVMSVNSQVPDGLGNVIVDDSNIPVVDPYSGQPVMLGTALTGIKNSTVRTVDNIQPDTNGNVALNNNYLGKTAKAADSEKVDGLDSGQLLRSDTGDTANGRISFAGGASFPNAGTPTVSDDAGYAYLLRSDADGNTKNIAPANINAGYATNAGHADNANWATNAGQLDGLDHTEFPRLGAMNTFTTTQTILGGLVANKDLQGASKHFALDSSQGYTYCYAPSSNAANYVKKTNSGSQYYLTNNSTLRMGDVAIHLSDIEANRFGKSGEVNYNYRQQALVDFGVPVRQTVEGEECIFLLEIIERLHTNNKELELELSQVKARLDAAGL